MLWALANLVQVAHVALFVLLTAGILFAAAGNMRGRPKLATGFWTLFAITLAWQYIPGCPLTSIERWLRLRVEPDWDRELSLLRVTLRSVTGLTPPAWSDVVFPATLGALATYALTRWHLAGLVARIRAALRPASGTG
jgi:hypothetical protein